MNIVDIEALLQDVEPGSPCGPNLEYDPEFLELEQAILGKPEVQYGDTITPATPPEWKVVARLAGGLLARSRDLRVAVAQLRALLALHGPAGFADGLALIERLLERRWDSVHPQLDPDDGLDPMLRINSLAALADPATLLREWKEAALLALPGLGPLSIRSLEVASGEVAPSEGAPKIELSSIEAALADIDQDRLQTAADALTRAHASAVNIEVALVRAVGSSQALNLDALIKNIKRGRDLLAGQLQQRGGTAAGAAAADAAPAGDAGASPTARAPAISGEIANRADVLRMLEKICKYYAQHEPSSPVPLLLERARRLVPKNFMEVLEDLAPDGIAQLLVISGPKKDES